MGDVSSNFDKCIVFKDGCYQVHLTWKETHPTLPDNYHLSRKRLLGLLHHLKQWPSVTKEYDTTIKDKGIVEPGETNYLPHHAVIQQDKQTTKLRVVYNASAKEDGALLNDCLYAGPKFDQNIMDIILRF